MTPEEIKEELNEVMQGRAPTFALNAIQQVVYRCLAKATPEAREAAAKACAEHKLHELTKELRKTKDELDEAIWNHAGLLARILGKTVREVLYDCYEQHAERLMEYHVSKRLGEELAKSLLEDDDPMPPNGEGDLG